MINTRKKLFLALLLAASLFTTACGNGDNKKADGTDCTKSSECQSNKCYDNGTKGVCGKSCASAADTSCGTTKECKEMPEKGGAASAKVFVCQTKAAAGTKKADGTDCTKSSECQSNKCYNNGTKGVCGKSCASAADTSCGTTKECKEMPKKDGAAADKVFVCQDKKADGEGCTKDAECENGLCVNFTMLGRDICGSPCTPSSPTDCVGKMAFGMKMEKCSKGAYPKVEDPTQKVHFCGPSYP